MTAKTYTVTAGDPYKFNFTLIASFDVECARVGICTCLICGAAIFVDPRDTDDPRKLHLQWHHSLDPRRRM